MSKATAHSRRRKSTPRAPEKRSISDAAIYGGFIMIGVFACLLAVPLLGASHWREVAVGYLAALAWLVNLYAVKAYLGRKLAGWQKALARLPLRFAGYGTRGGRPIEAAHGQPEARTALIAGITASVVIVVVLALLLLPGLI